MDNLSLGIDFSIGCHFLLELLKHYFTTRIAVGGSSMMSFWFLASDLLFFLIWKDLRSFHLVFWKFVVLHLNVDFYLFIILRILWAFSSSVLGNFFQIISLTNSCPLFSLLFLYGSFIGQFWTFWPVFLVL